jgi:hypothetical protein
MDAKFELNILRKSLFTEDSFCYHVKFQIIQILILHLFIKMTVFHAHCLKTSFSYQFEWLVFRLDFN